VETEAAELLNPKLYNAKNKKKDNTFFFLKYDNNNCHILKGKE
jgi:hypothetical protein